MQDLKALEQSAIERVAAAQDAATLEGVRDPEDEPLPDRARPFEATDVRHESSKHELSRVKGQEQIILQPGEIRNP